MTIPEKRVIMSLTQCFSISSPINNPMPAKSSDHAANNHTKYGRPKALAPSVVTGILLIPC